jgi:hypothetical protein
MDWPASGSLMNDGWAWKPLAAGGVITLHKSTSNTVHVDFAVNRVSDIAGNTLRVWMVSNDAIVIQTLDNGNSQARVEILDVTGKCVIEEQVTLTGEWTELHIGLQPGFYLVRVISGETSATQKLLVN